MEVSKFKNSVFSYSVFTCFFRPLIPNVLISQEVHYLSHKYVRYGHQAYTHTKEFLDQAKKNSNKFLEGGGGALTHSTQQHIKSFHLIPQDYIWDLIHDCHKTDQGNWQEESVYKFLVDWDTESCPLLPSFLRE